MALLRTACLTLCLLAVATGDDGSCDDPQSDECQAKETDADQALLQVKKHPGKPDNATLLESSSEGVLDCSIEMMKCGFQFHCMDEVAQACENQAGWLPSKNCSLSSSKCPIYSITEPTLVYPGGDTKCLDGSPYAFYVQPGDKKKLILMFQGGGFCSSAESDGQVCNKHITFAGMTGQSSSPSSKPGGIFNTSTQNPYRLYTKVQFMYCSGDLHVGTGELPGSPPGNPVVRRGYANVRAALDWVVANFGSGSLADLAIMGSSAGSLGAQAWSATILSSFTYQRAVVVMDSQSGLASEDPVQDGPTMPALGICDVPLLNDELVELCHSEKLSWQKILDTHIRLNPAVQYRLIMSKYDAVLIYFYTLGAIAAGRDPLYLSPPDMNTYYGLVNQYIAPLFKRTNFEVFYVNAAKHQYLHDSSFFTTSSWLPNDQVSNLPRMASWCFASTSTSQCTGSSANTRDPQCFFNIFNIFACRYSWCNITAR